MDGRRTITNILRQLGPTEGLVSQVLSPDNPPQVAKLLHDGRERIRYLRVRRGCEKEPLPDAGARGQ